MDKNARRVTLFSCPESNSCKEEWTKICKEEDWCKDIGVALKKIVTDYFAFN